MTIYAGVSRPYKMLWHHCSQAALVYNYSHWHIHATIPWSTTVKKCRHMLNLFQLRGRTTIRRCGTGTERVRKKSLQPSKKYGRFKLIRFYVRWRLNWWVGKTFWSPLCQPHQSHCTPEAHSSTSKCGQRTYSYKPFRTHMLNCVVQWSTTQLQLASTNKSSQSKWAAWLC